MGAANNTNTAFAFSRFVVKTQIWSSNQLLSIVVMPAETEADAEAEALLTK